MSKKVLFIICVVLGIGTMYFGEVKAEAASVSYMSHVRNIGDTKTVSDGQTSGTTGKNLPIEYFGITLSSYLPSGDVMVAGHVQNKGWGWELPGKTGSRGNVRHLEAITLRLTGNVNKSYNILYRVHVKNKGWMEWKSNGGIAGTTGQNLGIEAVQVKLVKK